MKREYILNGEKYKLSGIEKRIGDIADNFEVVGSDLEPIDFYSMPKGVKIIGSCTSLNTPICSMQTKRLNAEIYISTQGLKAYNISVDLPFFQNRYSFEEDIEFLTLLSDHKGLDFGYKYGVVIEELRLLSRALFVLDENNIIRYVEYVMDNQEHFNYLQAVKVAKTLIAAM